MFLKFCHLGKRRMKNLFSWRHSINLQSFVFTGHIRSYSEDPSLKDIQLGQGGRSPFITRLQVLGKSLTVITVQIYGLL